MKKRGKKDNHNVPKDIAGKDKHLAKDSVQASAIVSNDGGDVSKKNSKFKWPPTKKQWIIIGLIVLILIVIALIFSVGSANKKTAVVVQHKAVVVAKPVIVPSNLTGLPVNPSLNNIPVTAVMVENSIDARPQSGLSQAGVVFEAVAEGGVTRFMALFQDTSPTDVGPIRSARPYYIQWALGFDAPYAHVGGSPDALADISSWNVKDLNEFSYPGSYHRISSRDAPHNVYTSLAELNKLEASKGYKTSTYTSWTRKKDKPLKVPTAVTINMNLSGPYYNPTFVYQPATNTYARSEAGAAQTDAGVNNAQVSPKVVVAIVVPLSQGALDATGAYYSDYNPIGSGTAYIFQDGNVTVGGWSKPSNTEQITFSDDLGKPMPINAGQTWITAVSSTANVTYAAK